MAGIDEHVAVIGEWPPLNPSPRTLFSSILGDDFGSRSFSDPQLDIESKEPLQEPEKQKLAAEPGGEDGVGDEISCNLVSGSSAFSSQRSGSRGSLAERMAARAGFNAPKLNTTRIRSSNMLSSTSPEVRSPYLTIPPGLSPTTLLDSPVFLSNSLAQYSPTTGKFSFGQSDNKSSILVPEVSDKNKDHLFQDIDTSSFMFKPHMESNVSYYLGTSDKVTSAPRNHQTLPSIDGSVQSAHPIMDQNLEVGRACSQNQQEYRPQADFSDTSVGNNTVCGIKSEVKASDDIVGSADHSSPPDDQEDGEGDLKGEHISSLAANAPSDDGYNWRKYGQKQVKGSEFPRSYYKCTHPNCQVKKKVERSHEGHITEIIYKGAHNHHPKPSPNRRVANGSSHPLTNIDTAEQPGPRTGFSGEPAWTGTQQGSAMAGPDRRHGGMETASSASVPTDCNPSAPVATQNGSRFDSSDPVDISSTLSNDDEDDDRGTHGSISLGYDEDGDESESKRRKVDASVMEISGATRAIREPRVVVQTTSEVDILDDGYRWRKYGQKVVKGNPNPRSYYKCTNAGCTVRKHVERASHDLKSVITTYEGKHNHDVPAARNSSHINSGTSGAAPQPAPRVTRPEPSPQFHDGMARFDGPTSLGTFVLPGRPPMGPMPSFTFGINQSSLANLAMASLGPGQAKLPNMPIHPFLGQHKLNEAGFVMPKGEPKEEPMSESGLPISNGAAFHQLMSRLPLGPHL